VKPLPTSSREEKEKWAWSKYVSKDFLLPTGDVDWGQHLINAICRKTLEHPWGEQKSKILSLMNDIKGVLEALVGGDGDVVNTVVGPKDARTPLHLACAMGSLPIAQLLLWHNANVKAVDSEGRSCLSLAKGAAKGQSEGTASSLVDLLSEMGCPDIGSLTRKQPPSLDRLPSSVI